MILEKLLISYQHIKNLGKNLKINNFILDSIKKIMEPPSPSTHLHRQPIINCIDLVKIIGKIKAFLIYHPSESLSFFTIIIVYVFWYILINFILSNYSNFMKFSSLIK
jgi:hypothetical protein